MSPAGPQIAGMGDYFLKGLRVSPTRWWGKKPLLFIEGIRLSSRRAQDSIISRQVQRGKCFSLSANKRASVILNTASWSSECHCNDTEPPGLVLAGRPGVSRPLELQGMTDNPLGLTSSRAHLQESHWFILEKEDPQLLLPPSLFVCS